MRLSVVILAAGKGKRMASDLPKVLHRVGGKPMLGHVLDTAAGLGAERCCVVYGHGGEAVRAAFENAGVSWVEQAERLGTGHAVAQAMPLIDDGELVLVLYGDVPLVRRETLQGLVETAAAGGLGLLTVELPDPVGYGRIVRDTAGHVLRIVEEKDTGVEERHIREVNTGILAVQAGLLRPWIQALKNDNAQGEYYLTDVIEMAVRDGVRVQAYSVREPAEVQGVNNRRQLAELERFFQKRRADELMEKGATLLDPARLDVRGSVTTGRDVVIDIDVIFEGEVKLGDRVQIGPHCVIRDSVLGDDVEILSHCIIDGAIVEKSAQVGPFARLRPEAQLAEGSKVGNFVEVKKSLIGPGSKVNHLTYIGDAEIGAAVNIGAGTITCNYDGANKHKTVIEDNVFIGSNTALVAPVRIGKSATVGAGSIISRDVPDGVLAIARALQKTIKNWQRPVKRQK